MALMVKIRAGEYHVLHKGEIIGEIVRVRMPSRDWRSGRQSNRSGHGEGYWAWHNGLPGEEYSTLRAAYEDLVKVRA